MKIVDSKYPIGKFEKKQAYSDSELKEFGQSIESFPLELESIVSGLNQDQLQYTYRQGGWNIGQIIHHCCDSHLNSFIRFKLAICEEKPSIKPFDESQWMLTNDCSIYYVDDSLLILKGLHKRWSALLRSLTNDQFKRVYYHPEQKREVSITEAIALYAWHCQHHLAHIRTALELKIN